MFVICWRQISRNDFLKVSSQRVSHVTNGPNERVTQQVVERRLIHQLTLVVKINGEKCYSQSQQESNPYDDHQNFRLKDKVIFLQLRQFPLRFAVHWINRMRGTTSFIYWKRFRARLIVLAGKPVDVQAFEVIFVYKVCESFRMRQP